MLVTKIYAEEHEVDPRLIPFQVLRAEIVEVVRAVVAAKADKTDNDPATAAGQLAYIYGTRHVRGLWRTKGWLLHRHENIESVRHPKKTLQVIYQSVDLACAKKGPQAVSGKGAGTDRMIDANQGCLFSAEEMAASHAVKFGKVDSGIWYLCVSINGDDVRAELSLPTGITDGNFDGFIERIFIIREGEWPKLASKFDASEVAEFEPVVKRK